MWGGGNSNLVKDTTKNTQIPSELEENLDQIKIAAPKKLHAFQFWGIFHRAVHKSVAY